MYDEQMYKTFRSVKMYRATRMVEAQWDSQQLHIQYTQHSSLASTSLHHQLSTNSSTLLNSTGRPISSPLSLSFPVRGTYHRPNYLQEAHHASWVGGVGVVSGGACLHVGQTHRSRCCAVSSSPPQCGHNGDCCCPIRCR